MSNVDKPQRIALLISPFGERWTTQIADTGRTPKVLHKGGQPFTVLMTMSVEHIAFANQWEATR